MSHHSLFPFLPCAARRRRGRRRRAADGFSKKPLPVLLRSFLLRGVGRRRRGEGRPHEDEEEAAHFLSRHHRCSVYRARLSHPLSLTVLLGDVKSVFFGAHMILLGSGRTISPSFTSRVRFHISLFLTDSASTRLDCTPTLCNHMHAPPTNCLLSDFRPPPRPPLVATQIPFGIGGSARARPEERVGLRA